MMTVVSEDAIARRTPESSSATRWESIRSSPSIAETRFFADLGLASIDAVVLGEAIQQHFGRPVRSTS